MAGAWSLGARVATELTEAGAGAKARAADDTASAAAAAWLAGLLVGAAVVGDGLDVGEVAVLEGVGVEVGLGDELGDVDDGLGLVVGEPLGLADDEGLTDGNGLVQLGCGDFDVPPPGPVAPPGPVYVPDFDAPGPPPPPPPPGVLWTRGLYLAGEITCGSSAIAHHATATTKTPVANAAAGRSQPSHPSAPARSDSGLNLVATTPATYRTQMTAGSSLRKSDQPITTGAAVRQRGIRSWCLAAMLARILSRPSAAGSTVSTASRSAFRSTASSAF